MIPIFQKPAQSVLQVAVKAATNPANVQKCTQIATQGAALVGGLLVVPLTASVVPKVASAAKGAFNVAVLTATSVAKGVKSKFTPKKTEGIEDLIE
mgnify:CR=1 FL=1